MKSIIPQAKKRISYFDYAATTPIDPLVLKSMDPILKKYFANTMSLHSLGQESKDLLERMRESFAKMIKCSSGEIIFTASATESNNFLIKGVAYANQNLGNHIIISGVEHACVLNTCKWLEKKGFAISYIPVDKNGIVNLDELKKLITDKTIIVSVMQVNNETGVIEPVEAVSKIIKEALFERKNKHIETPLYFHVDAAQAFGKREVNVEKIGCDLLTLSSHKIYGPKGAAIAFIKKDTRIACITHGGGHEFGFRSGTVNIPAICGFNKAAEMALNRLTQESKKISKFREKIIKNLTQKVPNIHFNVDQNLSVPHIISVRFDFIEGESLVYLLDNLGICVSSASACASTSLSPSHVLIAMGLKPEEAHGTIRISLGRFTSSAEINTLNRVLPELVSKLRNISPLSNSNY